MNFAIHEVPVPGDGPLHPLLLALVGLDLRVWREIFGHDDFHDDATAWRVTLTPTAYSQTRAWVALPADLDPTACSPTDAVGGVTLALPLREDLTTAHVMLGVPLAYRNRGVGEALWDTVVGALGDRTTVQTWVHAPETSPADVRAVTAASGSGSIDGTAPAARWLLHRGFVLEQAERYSILLLTPDLTRDLAIHERAAAALARPAYELVTWRGAAPTELRADLATMHGVFSTEVPTAGLDVDEQVWDAARVDLVEQRYLERGRDRVRVAARHVASTRLVAYTDLQWPLHNPAGVVQQITIVHPDHRGHRLGMWLKAANLRQLLEVNPDAARVHTWNADENTHMLSINEALGFRNLGLEGAWQKRL